MPKAEKGRYVPSPVLVLVAVLVAQAGASAAPHQPDDAGRQASEAPRLRIDTERSYLVAVTTRAGALGFLGHEHGVLAPEWEAEVRYDPADLASAQASVSVAVPALLVDTEMARRRARLGEGPSSDEVDGIRERMLGADQLDADSHPAIRFVSETVEMVDPLHLRVSGTLTLHGISRPVETVMTVRPIEQFLLFHGELAIRQTDFGITPVSIGGVVKVGDEVRIRYAIWTLPGP